VLRSYQGEGVRWLTGLRDLSLPALLADDMGLGKTLQALCALRGRTLVVAPTSVVPNWAAEAARFRPALRVCVYHGPARALDPAADLTLTSYALLRLDADELCAVDWETVVLDESQAIKNADSQVARAAHRLPGRFRLALTGTPVENRLAELWSQFHYLSRGWLGSQSDFDERYARPIAAGDPEAAERLRARVRPFVLRRHKRDVAPELPPRTEVVLHVELATDERQVYDAIRAATREEVAARFAAGGSAFQVLEALLRLRQAACDAALVPGARSSAPPSSRCCARTSRSPSPRDTRRSCSRSGRRCSTASSRYARGGAPVRAPRRIDARPRGGGRGVPERERPARDDRVAARRRNRAQPDRGRQRVHPRSLVEPRGRGAGRRPRAPDRSDATRDGVPAGRLRHRSRSACSRSRRASARSPRPRSALEKPLRSRARSCSSCSADVARAPSRKLHQDPDPP
jgi:hypothetical protein